MLSSPGCWVCNPPRCTITDGFARFGTQGRSSPAMTQFLLGPGRTYRLSYDLENGGGPLNSWETRVHTTDGPTFTAVFDKLDNSMPFKSTNRVFTIVFPPNSTMMQVTFMERQVCLWSVTSYNLYVMGMRKSTHPHTFYGMFSSLF
jgi:hypothetical protein